MDAVFVVTGNTAVEVRDELRYVLKDRENLNVGRRGAPGHLGRQEYVSRSPQ